MTEQEQFHHDAGEAIHEVAFLSAKFGIPPDTMRPKYVTQKVAALLLEVEGLRKTAAEAERLRHDVDALKTTLESEREAIAVVKAQHQRELNSMQASIERLIAENSQLSAGASKEGK